MQSTCAIRHSLLQEKKPFPLGQHINSSTCTPIPGYPGSNHWGNSLWTRKGDTLSRILSDLATKVQCWYPGTPVPGYPVTRVPGYPG
eukprot:3330599-Rhodomonas_salina.1